MANVFEYITSDAVAANYANLGQASGFAGLNEALKGDKLTLIAPKNDLLGKDKIPMAYRWNPALTKELLLNHVASNVAPFTSTSTDLEALSKETFKVNDTTVDGKDVSLAKEEAGKFLVYDLEGVLVPTTQSGTSALDKTLLDGASPRLGNFFAKYATGDFYTNSLTGLNNEGSDDLFSSKLAYTVFLPEAEAWAALTKEVEELPGTVAYLEDKGLDTALQAHITKGGEQVTDMTYSSLAGSDIVVSGTDVTIAGEAAKIGNTVALNFKNGQVHNIDAVLQFPRKTTVGIASTTTVTSTLAKLVTDYKLVDALNGLKRSTIFAPSNDALKPLVTFATWNTVEMTTEVMTNILKHHVVAKRVYSKELPSSGKVADALDGEAITLTDLDVDTADVVGTNGNIHIVKKALLPPSLTVVPAVMDVVAVAETGATELYSQLSNFADVVNTLKAVSPGTSYTVFAPTNEAFAALTEEDMAYLKASSNEKLGEVLKYHVVPTAKLAGSLTTTEFGTVLGDDKKLTVTVADGEVLVAGGKVIKADLKAINGVVHIIDKVLIPPSVTLPSSQMGTAASMSLSAVGIAMISICAAAL